MELLHFQRCDRFYEIINENLELAACRQELEAAGFSVDLGVQNLGNGKLLVPVELAERAIDALRKRQRQTGKRMVSGDSACFFDPLFKYAAHGLPKGARPGRRVAKGNLEWVLRTQVFSYGLKPNDFLPASFCLIAVAATPPEGNSRGGLRTMIASSNDPA